MDAPPPARLPVSHETRKGALVAAGYTAVGGAVLAFGLSGPTGLFTILLSTGFLALMLRVSAARSSAPRA